MKNLAIAKAVVETSKEHIREVFGDTNKIQELQPDTIAEKERHGAARPDAPLIDTGALRDSLVTSVVEKGYGIVGYVGTEDEKMYWHEFGTTRVPPRPVMAIGCAEAATENLLIITEGNRSIATGVPGKIREPRRRRGL
ncbi:MAG: hypothetical protein NVSMB31_13990 [Vulcanimicrobiaceae bacterium]